MLLKGGKKKMLEAIEYQSYPLDSSQSLSPLLDSIGDKRIVMLGEASHGTHEYYTWRTAITKRLIREKGFNLIGVEGEWPDCYRLNRYIKNYPGAEESALEVLKKIDRWPTWMWANWEIVALAEWLCRENQTTRQYNKAGFYGLDVYSLWDSLTEIINYLDKTDPETATYARKSASCFENYSQQEDGQTYAWATRMYPGNCQEDVVAMLTEIRKRVAAYDGDPEAAFNVEQNARIAVGAEKYYRSMGGPQDKSWNVRDTHMVDTLNHLLNHAGPQSKAVIWAHNTHIGDARATTMAGHGLVNIGQLVREAYGAEQVFLVGFGSYQGTVIAGASWGAKMEIMPVPPAGESSWEHLLHSMGYQRRLLMTGKMKKLGILPHRAIGVVYHPEGERHRNYVESDIAYRYDAFLYLDTTTALHPLHLTPNLEKTPETFPFDY